VSKQTFLSKLAVAIFFLKNKSTWINKNHSIYKQYFCYSAGTTLSIWNIFMRIWTVWAYSRFSALKSCSLVAFKKVTYIKFEPYILIIRTFVQRLVFFFWLKTLFLAIGFLILEISAHLQRNSQVAWILTKVTPFLSLKSLQSSGLCKKHFLSAPGHFLINVQKNDVWLRSCATNHLF